MLHAVGQGALGIECRDDDLEVRELLKVLDHRETRLRCEAERAFMRELEGGCSVPLGVWTEISEGKLSLKGTVCSLDGKKQVFDEASGEVSNGGLEVDAAKSVGRALAASVVAKGGADILREARSSMPAAPLNLAPALAAQADLQIPAPAHLVAPQ
jgi:hydroxymethylbilane synthase